MDKANLRLLSNIINKIQSETDNDEFRRRVLDIITVIIPCDQASFYTTAEANGKIVLEDDPILCNIAEDIIDSYKNKYVYMDYVIWLIENTKEIVFRETDLLEDSLRLNTEYYKELYSQIGIQYSLQACLYYSGKMIGLITLFRKKESGDFSDDDVFWLELLQTHISRKLYEIKHGREHIKEGIKASDKENAMLSKQEDMKMTSREQEIVNYILEGYTNEELAEELYISVNTVKKHLANIYLKLGIKSRWELLKLK